MTLCGFFLLAFDSKSCFFGHRLQEATAVVVRRFNETDLVVWWMDVARFHPSVSLDLISLITKQLLEDEPLMAAIEARVLWHRTANRCPILEDATLASSPSSTEKNDSSGADTTSVPEVIPWNNSFETKWWLQLQPNIECLKDINFSHLSSLEHETDEKSLETISPASKFDGKPLPFDSIDDVLKMEESFLESPRMVSTDLMKNNSKTLVKEISMTTNYPQQPLKRKADMNFAYKEEELLVLKLDEQLPSRRIDKMSELGSPWATINKSEPRWRSTDKDDLYLLVAQTSLHHIENCDLPKPTQIIGINKQADDNGVFQSSLDRNPKTGMCDANEYSHDTPSSGRLNKDIPPHQRCYGEHDSRKLYGYHGGCAENRQPSSQTTEKPDPKRAQMLEALRHSQTRARKAEMSAQKAYREKEHAVKLLFRQVSHLFAYRQWLHILQLENLSLQLKLSEDQISTIVPLFPWMPLQGLLSARDKKGRRKRNKCNMGRYTVAFSVGLGLLGIGLLLGWTISFNYRNI